VSDLKNELSELQMSQGFESTSILDFDDCLILALKSFKTFSVATVDSCPKQNCPARKALKKESP